MKKFDSILTHVGDALYKKIVFVLFNKNLLHVLFNLTMECTPRIFLFI